VKVHATVDPRSRYYPYSSHIPCHDRRVSPFIAR
jgi:hypothetical protein